MFIPSDAHAQNKQSRSISSMPPPTYRLNVLYARYAGIESSPAPSIVASIAAAPADNNAATRAAAMV
jgi:hypothetical protein